MTIAKLRLTPPSRRAPRCLAWLLSGAGALGCATASPTPPPAGPVSAPPPPSSPMTPPPFSAPAAAGAQVSTAAPGAARVEMRRAILDAAWKLVRDKHYDKTLGGLDWAAVRDKHEPAALGAPTEVAFYRALNDMIGELRQSHMMVSGPGAQEGAEPDDDAPPPAADTAAAPAGETGDPGLTVRVIEGRPTVTHVRPGSSAERAGLKPGFLVTHLGGREIKAAPRSHRPLRPVEERYFVRLAAARRLAGRAGTKVTVRYLDHDDRPGEVMLERDAPKGASVRLGHLLALYPDVRISEINGIGVIRFNLFLFEPVLTDIQRAIESFRARGLKGLILDMRGNPGGQGSMAVPIAAQLVAGSLVLGTMQYRDFPQTLTAAPSLGVKPFSGPVVVLTDEGSASTSEILAASLQEAGRARVIGDGTLGAVLPSIIEALPGGAVMQYVIADFKTPRGVLLEGRGVQPDLRVIETRAALKSGRDPVLDAALVAIRAPSAPRPAASTAPTAAAAAASSPSTAPPASGTGGAAADGGLAGVAASPPAPPRPYRAVLDDYIAATGGRAHYQARKSMRMKAQITVRGLAITGTVERITTRGDRSLTVTSLPGVGSPSEGSDGKEHWTKDPVSGLRILTGAEAEQARLDAAWNPELRLAKLYKKIESRRERSSDGAERECLDLTPKLAPPITNCYDAATHLLVTQQGSRPTPHGPVPFSLTVKEWLTSRGLKLPSVTETKAGPVTFDSRLTDVFFDEPVDRRIFAVPSPGGAK